MCAYHVEMQTVLLVQFSSAPEIPMGQNSKSPSPSLNVPPRINLFYIAIPALQHLTPELMHSTEGEQYVMTKLVQEVGGVYLMMIDEKHWPFLII